MNTLYRHFTGFWQLPVWHTGPSSTLFFVYFQCEKHWNDPKWNVLNFFSFFFFLNEMTKITLKKNKGNTSTQVKQKKKRKQKIHKYSVAPYKTSTIYFIRLCIALFYIILRSARKEHQLLPFALGDKKSNTNQTMWIFSFFFSLLVLPWCKKGAYTHPFTLTQIAANTCK